MTPDHVAGPTPQGDADLGLQSTFEVQEQLSQNPALRVRQLARVREQAAWDYIKETLHQLIITRMPVEQIAQRFDVNIRTVHRWRERYREEMRNEATQLQGRDFAMERYRNLSQQSAEAWKMYHTTKAIREKALFLNIANRADVELGKLGQLLGLLAPSALDPTRYETREGDHAGSTMIADMARSFLSGAAPPAGFNPMPVEDVVLVDDDEDDQRELQDLEDGLSPFSQDDEEDTRENISDPIARRLLPPARSETLSEITPLRQRTRPGARPDPRSDAGAGHQQVEGRFDLPAPGWPNKGLSGPAPAPHPEGEGDDGMIDWTPEDTFGDTSGGGYHA